MIEVIGIDHIYISVADLQRAEIFYDKVFFDTLGFRKSEFMLSGDAHIQYFNRHFGYVLRPARTLALSDSYAPGLHHLCLRVESISDVLSISAQLRDRGIEATAAKLYPEYAPDYWATYFTDPDGTLLEVSNYRLERRERHDNWSAGTKPFNL